MGVYKRYRTNARGRRVLDSPFYWMALERDGRPPIRQSTRVLIDGATPGARRDQRQLAEEVYRANMGDLARGTFKLRTIKPRITFAAHADWYRDHISKTHRNYRREKSMLKNLKGSFGEFCLDEIEESTIDEWKALRVTEVSKTTVNRELEILKPLMAKAIPKYLDKSPAAAIKKFRLPRFPPITILTYSAEDAILAVATPEERAFVLLGLDALLRLSDVRTFNVANFHGTYIQIVNPKTIEPYKVPTSTRLRQALEAIAPAAREHNGFLFSRRMKKGKWQPIGEATAFTMFAELCARADVPRGRELGGITFHGLRHTGTSRALRATKPTAVRELGGWSTTRQLDRYDHPDGADLIRGVEAIGARPESRNVHALENGAKKAAGIG